MDTPLTAIAFPFIWGWPFMIGPIIIALCIGALPFWAIWHFTQLVQDEAKALAIYRAFENAGNLRGLTFEQIVAIGGEPIYCFDYPEGKRVAVFGNTRYKIVLVFRGGLCEGVSSETTS